MRPDDRKLLRGLYPVTPDDYLLPRLSAHVSMALAGGVHILQYRNKTAPAPLRRSQAAELLRICHGEGVRLIVNDDLALALEIGADGVHLGREDGDLVAARQALGEDGILGVSCYGEMARAEEAAAAGADYLAFGTAFPSVTKPEAAVIPLSLMTEARARFGLPVAAIGGITLARVADLLAAGVDMAAVITDLFEAMDIASRARSYQKAFSS
jgi:thiamine-phosphate pyrophosphorylase